MDTDAEVMLIWTKSSLYEVDGRTKRIRRTIGFTSPTERVGIGWKKFQSVHAKVGAPAEILWGITPEGIFQMTITSNVVAIGPQDLECRDQGISRYP